MQNSKTKMIGRYYHPDPDQVMKYDSASPSVFVALMMHPYEPEWTEEIYRSIVKNHVVDAPLGLGSFLLDARQRNSKDQLLNPGTEPAMIGENALGIFVLSVAAREFQDKDTWNRINTTLTNVMKPRWVECEVRYNHDRNLDPSGMSGYTIGQVYNMMSGWVMLGKVHVGWKTILEHDWSKHRDAAGRPIDTIPW